MECIFYSYFENIKSYYSMKVKKDGGFYNINFIDSQLEISDINNILQDHLINLISKMKMKLLKFKLLVMKIHIQF